MLKALDITILTVSFSVSLSNSSLAFWLFHERSQTESRFSFSQDYSGVSGRRKKQEEKWRWKSRLLGGGRWRIEAFFAPPVCSWCYYCYCQQLVTAAQLNAIYLSRLRWLLDGSTVVDFAESSFRCRSSSSIKPWCYTIPLSQTPFF